VFGQDVHRPLDPSLLSSLEDYLASLQRLLDLDADILCEGQCGIFEGKDAVARYIRRFKSKTDERARGAVGGGEDNAREGCAAHCSTAEARLFFQSMRTSLVHRVSPRAKPRA
jgi:hypothetical protein